jgi:hypothetical protein
VSQASLMAHLRPLRRCHDCGQPATQELFNGLNASLGVYCDKHARLALTNFKQASKGRSAP